MAINNPGVNSIYEGIGGTSANNIVNGIDVFSTSSPNADLNTNLVSFWLNTLPAAMQTNINDSGGNNTNNLTNNNGTVLTNSGIAAGTYDATFVSTSSQSLTVASNSTLQVGGKFFTVVGWIKTPSVLPAASQHIIQKANTTVPNSNYEFAIQYAGSGTNRFQCACRDPSASAYVNVVANTFGALSPSTWYFVVYQYDVTNKVGKISVNNGAFDTSAIFTSNPPAGSASFCIGGNANNNNQYFDGGVLGVGLWTGATSAGLLTSGQLTRLYNNGTPLMPTASSGF